MNNRIQPGMVVIARVFNPFENPSSTGKRRPCIVIERQGGQVLLVGLTTNPRRRNGDRVHVPNPARLGLHGTGYIWGHRLVRVSALDVDQTIGWCTPEVAHLVTTNVYMSSDQADQLTAAAWKHHTDLAA